MDKKKVVGYICGSFDLFHIGHLNILKKSKEMCDYLVVGVHKDGSHKNVKLVIPFEERKAIVKAIRYVDQVIDAPSEDPDAWDIVHYDLLFVGSDYKGTERFKRFEERLAPLGVKIIYFDYTKGVSSTELRQKIKSQDKEKK